MSKLMRFYLKFNNIKSEPACNHGGKYEKLMY